MARCLLVGVDVGETIVPIRVCGRDMVMVNNFRNCEYFAVGARIYLLFFCALMLHFTALHFTALHEFSTIINSQKGN